jgi:hypothetical protein
MGYSLSRRDRDKVQRAVTNSRLSYASNVNYHRTYGGSGGDPYKGYFKVIKANETDPETEENVTKIKVVDGAMYQQYSTFEYCGIALIGQTYISVEVAEIEPSNGILIFKVSLDTETDELNPPEIIIEGINPYTQLLAEPYTYKKILARITYDGTNVGIIQEHFGEIQGYIIGDCD